MGKNTHFKAKTFFIFRTIFQNIHMLYFLIKDCHDKRPVKINFHYYLSVYLSR